MVLYTAVGVIWAATGETAQQALEADFSILGRQQTSGALPGTRTNRDRAAAWFKSWDVANVAIKSWSQFCGKMDPDKCRWVIWDVGTWISYIILQYNHCYCQYLEVFLIRASREGHWLKTLVPKGVCTFDWTNSTSSRLTWTIEVESFRPPRCAGVLCGMLWSKLWLLATLWLDSFT